MVNYPSDMLTGQITDVDLWYEPPTDFNPFSEDGESPSGETTGSINKKKPVRMAQNTQTPPPDQPPGQTAAQPTTTPQTTPPAQPNWNATACPATTATASFSKLLAAYPNGGQCLQDAIGDIVRQKPERISELEKALKNSSTGQQSSVGTGLGGAAGERYGDGTGSFDTIKNGIANLPDSVKTAFCGEAANFEVTISGNLCNVPVNTSGNKGGNKLLLAGGAAAAVGAVAAASGGGSSGNNNSPATP